MSSQEVRCRGNAGADCVVMESGTVTDRAISCVGGVFGRMCEKSLVLLLLGYESCLDVAF